MKNLLLFTILLLASVGAHAQEAVSLCSYVTTNGISTCQPVTTANRLPITLGTSGASIAIGNTVTSGTTGSVLFINPTATLAQDNANFFWDATNHRLGIGTTIPTTSEVITANTGNIILTIGPYAGSGGGEILFSSMNSGVGNSPFIQTSFLGAMEFKSSGNFSFTNGTAINPSAGSFAQFNGNISIGTTYIGLSAPTNGMIVQGNVGIGTSTATGGPLVIAGLTTGSNADFLCLSSTGVVLLQASSCTISKREFKENIYDLDDSALDEVMAFKPVQFNMKAQKDIRGNIVKNADKNFSHTQIGFIAEDVGNIDPRVTVYEQDEITPKSWDERKFVALLTKAVQVEQHEIESFDQTKIVHKNKFGQFMDWLEGVR